MRVIFEISFGLRNLKLHLLSDYGIVFNEMKPLDWLEYHVFELNNF
jgi:hypothetical protein